MSPRPRTHDEKEMAAYLAQVATGPRLSKDLSREQARHAMSLILEQRVDPVQAAVFLVALRMKRETHDELSGILDALRERTAAATADVDDLVDMAEPYNGYVRHLPAAPFLPALLSACGVPCVVHGCREIGPKFGVTAHRILAAAGAPVDHSVEHAAARIARDGWAYVDVQASCPALARMNRLRTLIVKRPCLSLLEKLLQPIAARGRTHLWIGYTHREYPEIIEALARDAGYHSMLAVRGVEGGVLTSLAGTVRAARYADPVAAPAPVAASDSASDSAPASPNTSSVLEHIDIAASEVVESAASRAPFLPGINEHEPPGRHATGHGAHTIGVDIPDASAVERWARHAADAGLAALSGERGPTADMMVLGAAAVLRHLGRVDTLSQGAERARHALRSGAAARAFSRQ